MIKQQKESIQVSDLNVIKVLKKPFTKRLIECFNDEPKSAGEIANSISFPKEKIYYHITKLLNLNILFVTSTDMVKGIEKKLFLPTAKKFIISPRSENIENPNELEIKHPKSSKSFPSQENEIKNERLFEPIQRKINERRRKNERRDNERRLNSNRRKSNKKFKGKDNRLNTNRRTTKDQRENLTRRNTLDRRFDDIKKINIDNKRNLGKNNKPKSIKYKNFLLRLNGVTKAMTFVHTGDCVTFLLCRLKGDCFEIERINNYVLPFKVKEYQINTLTDLIINVSNQFNKENQKKKIYLAIHSDNYQYEMTYVSAKGKNQRLFNKDLINTLNNTYDLNQDHSIFDYISYPTLEKNATVLISNKKDQIKRDYSELIESGLQPRYNTSIPQILNNIYTYYNLDQNDEYSLLIYIDRKKTHVVFSKEGQLFESKEFNRGLNYFADALMEMTLVNASKEEAMDNALHFLSHFGLGKENSESTIQDGIPVKKARSIIEHLYSSFIDDLKESIYYFEKILLQDGFAEQVINQIFICGVGSHIKNLDRSLSDSLRMKVNNLSEYNSAYLQDSNQDKGPLLERIKTNGLFKKKETASSQLQSIKKKIVEHEKAIESAQSPESAKYRLTRLEIEKDSKLKSIESANQKLISASKEFKQIKEEYVSGQEDLKSDLNSVTTLLEEQSDILIDRYKEHEEIGNTISELEYESDRSKNKGDKERQERKGKYQSRVKNAARSRAKLGDDRENLEQEIDDLETTILKLEESFYHINQKIENGQDELSVFEYLKDSIQATANTFKRSFLEHMKSIENLTKDDLNTLQRSGYLLTQNTKRIDEIKDSFSSIISGDIDTDPETIIDGDGGLEIREKLLKILTLVIEAPDNLIHLKNLTASIIKINESQSDLLDKSKQIQNQSRQSKRSIRENKKSLTSLRKEIDVHEKEMTRKVNDRQKEIDLLKYVRETIEMIHDLEHHAMLIKELKPQKKLHNDEINDISSRMVRLKSLLESCENAFEHLELEDAELTKVFDQDNKVLNEKMEILTDEENITKKALDSQSEKMKSIMEDVANAHTYIEQLEKQVVSKKKEIEGFNEDKSPLVEALDSDRKKLILQFESQQKILDQEELRKISEAKKSKSVTIEAYFKKERIELEKKDRLLDRELSKAKKEKTKVKSERDKAQSSLSEMKRKNMPNMSDLKKQIKGWEKDLNQGRRFQERLDALEGKKREWDDQLSQESKSIKEQIDSLKNTIERKRSDSYILFLKDGLNRFKNEGDADEIARSMAEESIKLDVEEIKKLKNDLEQFMGRYEAFMVRHRKSHRNVLEKLKPYGGRKKTIVTKIQNAKGKVHKKESMIRALVLKVDEKNESLILRQNNLNDITERVKETRAEIKDQIKNIPNKKKRAKLDIDRRLKERLSKISEKRVELNNEKNDHLRLLNIAFDKETLIVKINEAEDRMVFFFNEIEKTKEKIELLLKEEESLSRSHSSLEKRLEKIFIKHDKNQIIISKKEEQFKEKSSNLNQKLESNRKEFSILQEQLLSLDQQKDGVISKLKKVEDDYNISNGMVSELKKKINLPEDLSPTSSSTKKKKTRVNRKEQLRYLSQMEKDMMVSVERSERMIKDLNLLIDSMNNERSGIESSITLLENDLEYYDKDMSRIEILIENNKEHLLKISSDHRRSLNGISNVKDLYPPSKIMLNERITNLYTLLELKAKDRDKLNGRLDDMKEDLKDRRVEIAMLDQELTKINEEMKNALENSFYEQDDRDDDWKWEIAEHKMNSYMDLAQLKTQSKELFNSIVEIEQEIAKLKNQQSSINNVISEKEKISHKKIKRMEEICTKLELQITKEKNELDGLGQEVKQLTGLAFNYGDRIDVLEQELIDFRERQTEYEIELKDLDRSLESIQDRSDKIMKRKRSVKGNSIQIDYMANLGLLMDPDLRLNLLPQAHKKEFKYFRPNQILQNAILVLITIFSIGSFVQRSRIAPLESLLPVKQSELSLLNMRQDMRDVVTQNNSVADQFSKLIKDDKAISADMVSMLKYLSQTIPMDFKITGLTLEKNQSKDFSKKSGPDHSELTMTLDGFFDKNQNKSSGYVEKLVKTLNDTQKFKKINVSDAKQLKGNKTGYQMRIIR